jgi:hypothetical protein
MRNDLTADNLAIAQAEADFLANNAIQQCRPITNKQEARNAAIAAGFARKARERALEQAEKAQQRAIAAAHMATRADGTSAD